MASLLDSNFINSIRGKKFHLIGSQAEGFYPHGDPSKNPVSNYCRHTFGRGQRLEDEFIVMKGVKFKMEYYRNGSCTKIEELLQGGYLIVVEEKFELVENCGFSSPSQASSVILVNNSSGPRFWRDEHNKTIKELEDIYKVARQSDSRPLEMPSHHETASRERDSLRYHEVKEQLLSEYTSLLGRTSSEEKKQLENIRVGQHILRNHLLHTRGKCPLANITNPDLLRVSHIKPWAKFEDIRLDPDNCLLLSGLWDIAFDRGLITFSQEGLLKFSNDIIKELDKFGSYNESISFDNIISMDNHLEYLKWHRENIFIGDAP